jgi:hypothetical protein
MSFEFFYLCPNQERQGNKDEAAARLSCSHKDAYSKKLLKRQGSIGNLWPDNQAYA